MNGPAHKGRCLCGRISFEADTKPLWVDYCHCNSCRRSTGAPVTTFVAFHRDSVRVTGEPKAYSSSPGVYRSFCGHCGTPLSYESDDCPGEIHFYISVMDAPDIYLPQRHVFHEEHISWLELNDDLPRYEGLARNEPASWGPKHQQK